MFLTPITPFVSLTEEQQKEVIINLEVINKHNTRLVSLLKKKLTTNLILGDIDINFINIIDYSLEASWIIASILRNNYVDDIQMDQLNSIVPKLTEAMSRLSVEV